MVVDNITTKYSKNKSLIIHPLLNDPRRLAIWLFMVEHLHTPYSTLHRVGTYFRLSATFTFSIFVLLLLWLGRNDGWWFQSLSE